MKKIRIQLSEHELWTLRNLLANHYHNDRRNLYWEKKRILVGQSDSRVYPLSEREKHLKQDAKLLKKLSKHLNCKWFER